MSRYEENRARIPLEDLRPYAGQWVAFSQDGSRIIAGAESLRDLEACLARTGVDAQKVALERIEFADDLLGGAEWL